MERDEILITSAIVHILETSVGMPILSEYTLDRDQDINDLIRGYIFKIATSDDLKKCTFDAGKSKVYQLLQDFDEAKIVEFSKEISEFMYDIMVRNVEIPSADFMVVIYQNAGKKYLALLKMNYKESFVHITANNEDGFNYNNIVKQVATLPMAGQKLSEAILINLEDYAIQIIEKKYDVNGEKTNYLSEIFLQCQTHMSQKTKLGIVKKAVDQINKKYFEDDIDIQMESKSIMQSEMAKQGAMSVEAVAKKMYKEYPTAKEEFEEKLEKYNLNKEQVYPQNEATVRKFQKQFLKTDTGIEINIPMEQYHNTNNVEFITNADGTISIIIKNVNHIVTK